VQQGRVGLGFRGDGGGEKPAGRWVAYRSELGQPARSSDKVHWVVISDDDNVQVVAVKDPLAVARLVDLLLLRASVPPYWVRRNGG
jgi:hypothetical protein